MSLRKTVGFLLALTLSPSLLQAGLASDSETAARVRKMGCQALHHAYPAERLDCLSMSVAHGYPGNTPSRHPPPGKSEPRKPSPPPASAKPEPFEVLLRVDAGDRRYTALQAQIAFDAEHYRITDLDGCLNELPRSLRGGLSLCTHPKPGIIQVVILDLSGRAAPIPNGVIGTIEFISVKGALLSG